MVAISFTRRAVYIIMIYFLKSNNILQYTHTHTHLCIYAVRIHTCYIGIYYYCITRFETFRTLFFLYYTIIIYRTVAAAAATSSSYKQLYSVCFYNKPFSVGRIRIVFIKHYEAVAVKLERPPPPRLMWSRPSEYVRCASTAVRTSPIYTYSIKRCSPAYVHKNVFVCFGSPRVQYMYTYGRVRVWVSGWVCVSERNSSKRRAPLRYI